MENMSNAVEQVDACELSNVATGDVGINNNDNIDNCVPSSTSNGEDAITGADVAATSKAECTLKDNIHLKMPFSQIQTEPIQGQLEIEDLTHIDQDLNNVIKPLKMPNFPICSRVISNENDGNEINRLAKVADGSSSQCEPDSNFVLETPKASTPFKANVLYSSGKWCNLNEDCNMINEAPNMPNSSIDSGAISEENNGSAIDGLPKTADGSSSQCEPESEPDSEPDNNFVLESPEPSPFKVNPSGVQTWIRFGKAFRLIYESPRSSKVTSKKDDADAIDPIPEAVNVTSSQCEPDNNFVTKASICPTETPPGQDLSYNKSKNKNLIDKKDNNTNQISQPKYRKFITKYSKQNISSNVSIDQINHNRSSDNDITTNGTITSLPASSNRQSLVQNQTPNNAYNLRHRSYNSSITSQILRRNRSEPNSSSTSDAQLSSSSGNCAINALCKRYNLRKRGNINYAPPKREKQKKSEVYQTVGNVVKSRKTS